MRTNIDLLIVHRVCGLYCFLFLNVVLQYVYGTVTVAGDLCVCVCVCVRERERVQVCTRRYECVHIIMCVNVYVYVCVYLC